MPRKTKESSKRLRRLLVAALQQTDPDAYLFPLGFNQRSLFSEIEAAEQEEKLERSHGIETSDSSTPPVGSKI
ncbi:hypothetical protein [Aureimonas psammosilenae]|uniref:hypothetical protein n=1 Tax=Aureimonas psammosilenae TaxID=2495496 RepID=UPI0012608133|nr:hypothetical protein [Aureimonas psammosilenae]